MTFPQRITALRKAKGKTQGQVAIALRIKQKTYAAYEEGRAMPRCTILYSIAEYYQVTTDSLLQINIIN